jgi:hypothetical protein
MHAYSRFCYGIGNLQELYAQLLERYKRVVEEKEDLSHKSKARLESHLQKELDFREKLGHIRGRVRPIFLA